MSSNVPVADPDRSTGEPVGPSPGLKFQLDLLAAVEATEAMGLPARLCVAGPVGCGQGVASRIIAARHGPNAPVVRVVPADLADVSSSAALERLRGFFASARGGVLLVEDLETLYADAHAVPLLTTLRELLQGDRSGPSGVSVVVCGDPDAVGRLHALNPDLHRFFVHAKVRNFSVEELAVLLVDALTRSGVVLAPGFAASSVALLGRVRALGNFRNARIVSALAAAAMRPSTPRPASGLTPGDIDVKDLKLASTIGVDGFAELDDLIGLADVKRTVRLWIANAELSTRREQLGLQSAGMGQHMVFKGPAGTAKTTVARIVGRILSDTGVLASGHLVEVQRADLVGETADVTGRRMVEIVKRALGGVLFIDEAYTLTATDPSRAGRDSGREAVDTLLKLMEDYREEFVVIVAGYPLEMEGFLNSNPGLRSRFSRVLDFPSYSPDELLDILGFLAAGRGYRVEPELRPVLVPRLALVSQYPGFGNGRHVRNLLESAIVRQATRVTASSPDDELRTLRVVDFQDPASVSSPGR